MEINVTHYGMDGEENIKLMGNETNLKENSFDLFCQLCKELLVKNGRKMMVIICGIYPRITTNQFCKRNMLKKTKTYKTNANQK